MLLEERLSCPIKSIPENDQVKNMIILYQGHNSMILTEYRVDRPQVKKVEDVVNEVIDLDDSFIQEQLGHIDQVKEDIKKHLWDKVVPTMVGSRIAEDEVQEELVLLLGEGLVNFEPYRKIVRDAAYSDVANHICSLMGLDKTISDTIINTKLNEVSKNELRRDALSAQRNGRKNDP